MAFPTVRFSALLVLAGAGLTAPFAQSSARAAAQVPAPTPAPSPAPTPNPPAPAPPSPAPAPDPPSPAPAPAPDTDKVPIITSISPASGPVGTQVVLRGTNLGGATEVDFGDVRATFSLSSATEVRTTVPAEVGLGPASVVVITPAGAAVSPTTFTVTAK